MLDVVFLKKKKLCTDQFYLFGFFRKYISSQDNSQVYFSQVNYFAYFKRDKNIFLKFYILIHILFSIMVTFFFHSLISYTSVNTSNNIHQC